MGKAARLESQAERRRKASRRNLLMGVGTFGLVAVLTGAVLRGGSEEAQAATGQIQGALPSDLPGSWQPSLDDTVEVYVGGKETWKRVPLRDVDGQFVHDGTLYARRPGPKLWIDRSNIKASELKRTLVDHSPRGNPWPEAEDVVRVLSTDSGHGRFARLRSLRGGDRVCFQSRIYQTVELDGYLQIKPTGDVFKRVTQTFKRKANTIIDLTIRSEADGGESVISGTPEHPFFVPALNRYVPMGELAVGTTLKTSDGSLASVASSRTRHGEKDVYNFEVEGTHNYYVASADGGPSVNVHNVCRADVLTKTREMITAKGGPLERLRRFDPDARIGIRGSTATGRVGNPRKATHGQPWDPKNFDLDLFIVSPKLKAALGEVSTGVGPVRGVEKVAGLGGVRTNLARKYPELFGGLRPGGKGVSVKVHAEPPPPGEFGPSIFFD